jgi:hypothetical protein
MLAACSLATAVDCILEQPPLAFAWRECRFEADALNGAWHVRLQTVVCYSQPVLIMPDRATKVEANAEWLTQNRLSSQLRSPVETR